MNLILFAIPFFILLIAIELIVDWRRGTGFYRLSDSVSSLNAGIFSRVTVVFWKLVPVVMYINVHENWALAELPINAYTWVIAFVCYDFFYYWHHRIGHERNIFWAAHVVHHSSEEYNLTTALRQTSGSIIGWIFYLPMALAGIEPIQVITVAALNLLYQFWVHTRHVPKLGWYEKWFITPSNHRVHHAINDRYIDRNYGGVFIIWDKMFGTFQEEVEEDPCLYGIRKPLKSWNPVWTNLHFYSQLAHDAWYTRRWRDKIGIWIARTGWRPDDVAERLPLRKFDIKEYKKFDIPVPFSVQLYALIHLVFTIGILGSYMAVSGTLTIGEILLFGGCIYASCTALGMILEQRQFAVAFEQLRLLLFAVIIMTTATNPWLKGLSMVVLSASLIMTYYLVPVYKESYKESNKVPASF